MRKRLVSPLLAAAAFAALGWPFAAPAALAQHAGEHAAAPKPVTLLPGLGAHRHPIATSSPEAQKYFDQGMVMLFGFNHEEAFRAFEKAAQLDPKAAMPHWGMALVTGANYNDVEPQADRLRKARAEVEKALALSKAGPENERAYAEALAKRYVADPASADKAALARDYNAAMRALSERYPDDLDAATLYAESGMNLRPWKLYDSEGRPAEGTEEIVAVLESVLRREPNHPGANHYYIHAVEASRHPERALASATRLETLVPNAGHLVHMPSHIYIRTGSYLAAEKSNAIAAEVDRKYIRETGAQGMYPMMYYTHNVHFQSAAAAMAGRHGEAKKSADLLFDEVLPIVSADPMLEGFLLQPVFVALRFQSWDDVRKMEDPGPKMPLLRAGWLYARAMAAAAAKDAQGADALRVAYGIARDAVPASQMAGPQNSAAAVLAVATPVLDARVAESAGDHAAALASWEKAVAAEDALAYDEPPGWYYPVRESLGGALLRAGRAADAERVFRADLDRHPRNPRSLLGLAKSLEAQGKSADAAFARAQFDVAAKDADVTLRVEDL
jgi:tetratricopeptide (TPR) repeat protein